MTVSLEDLTDQMLKAAQQAGADGADAIAIDGTSLSIEVRNGALEQAERAEGTDIGLRVLVGQKQACVSASDTNPGTLREMAERAVTMARLAPDDPYIRLAEPGELATDLDVTDLDLCDPADEPSANDLQDRAATAEASALAYDGISQVSATTAAYGARRIHLSTSQGFSGGYSRTDNVTSCVAISGTGLEMQRDYDGDHRVYLADLRSAESIGASAAERALAMQGARKPPSGQFTVVYDERISASLIGHFLSAVTGTNVARGSSWLLDKLETQIFPDTVSIVENPHRPRSMSSKKFDAEGLPTSRRVLIDDGVLTGWTLDLATGARMGMPSTASAQRGVGAPPSPGVGNIEVTPSDKSQADLLKDMGTGLLITSMIGATINPNTGDYSRGASGFWVEGGEIAYPVNECTVAGNLLDMLRTIIPANDARPHLSRVVPSFLVEGLTLAGA